MSRLLARAAVVSVATALILTRVGPDRRLVIWELLLLLVLVWQLRELPTGSVGADRPLFDRDGEEPVRLPRAVAVHELAVVDAVNGYLAPERRLRPALRRVASHRLARSGIDVDSDRGRELIGEPGWDWLTSSSPPRPDIAGLEATITRLEAL